MNRIQRFPIGQNWPWAMENQLINLINEIKKTLSITRKMT
jgi:hypothetical protein